MRQTDGSKNIVKADLVHAPRQVSAVKNFLRILAIAVKKEQKQHKIELGNIM